MPIDFDPTGYRLRAPVQENATTIVYRAERARDGRAVVLKMLKREAATPGAVASYRHELEMLESLRIPGVVQVLGLEMVQGLPMLVLEDFGAESLAKLRRAQRFDLARVLVLACRLADILGELHERGIIHRDVNPANVLLNQDNGELKLADFGSSVRFTGDPSMPGSSSALVGTLAYMAPEQTGRMNRPMDYRADFYSLGVTLYELCAGRLPFDTDDPLELVHSHLARHPVPVLDLEPGVPEAISDIVSKLMAKMPEDRYQSARGCAHDLRECQSQLQSRGHIQRFILGEYDVNERFQISSRLYGRDREQTALRSAFARVVAGAKELVLVAGYPGIGKSALVKELAVPSTRRHARFIDGKFDQYRRNVPYSALAGAFGVLVGQLLTEPEERLAHWRQALQAALGPSGQVLVDVIPDLAFLVGSQPPVAKLGPAETENRLNVVFQRFLELLCSAELPLVLFLDDLQWADAASLRLLRLMLADPDVSHLLIIGTYRDSEVDATHPLMLTLDQVRNDGVTIERIVLGPLGIEHVRQLLADTLQRSASDCTELADLVVTKTEGNPFFVGQFLRTLHQDQLLGFDRALRGWRWDLAVIHALGITDNVVDLMLERIRKLPAATQRILELAACAGNVFEIDTLAIICEDSSVAIHGHLLPAIEFGLVRPLSAPEVRPGDGNSAPALVVGSHAFAHDRVQQAAYALGSDGDKAAIHLGIARLLERALAPGEREQRIFELAEHFVLGAALLDDPAEQLAVAHLCLVAGRRAQESMARDTALRFLRAGLALVPAPSWQAHYALMRDLALAAVEAAYLTGDFEPARRLSEDILANARALLDKIEVYDLQILFHFTQGQMGPAMEITLDVLAMLGMILPRDPDVIRAREQTLRAALALDEAGFEALEHLPTLTDRHQAAILRILIRASSATYHVDPALWRLLALVTVEHCMRHGHSSLAAMAYAQYGGLLCGLYQDLERGYRFGVLAMRLIERFPDPALEVKVSNTFWVLVMPWSGPIREALTPLQMLIQRGLEGGDLEFGLYCAVHHLCYQLTLDAPLENVHRDALAYLALMERHHLPLHRDWVWPYERIARELLGLPRPENDPGPPTYTAFLMQFEWHRQAMLS
jgi:predicted ATPase